MHTIEMFEDKRKGFMGNTSDVVGDVTLILFPAESREFPDDMFIPSPCQRNIVSNAIVSLSGSIRELVVNVE